MPHDPRLIALLVIVLSGCAAAETYRAAYQHVDYRDGIDRREAMVIAQMSLSRSPEKEAYKIKYPRIMKNQLVRAHDDHWFVAFSAESFDQAFWEFLVVIRKADGDVVFSEPHVPLDHISYDWIFEQ